ncbi:hypothetical protein B6V74_09590 [Thioclava sp. F42-5]|uniref:hypothetical protein n=1 Tax=Thioclava sp. F42-5 TaxID=1973005 RepID=UPI000B53B9FE|nr:hypothetical protein [Thioclava sp. F42-5]OWY08911.1 hypothetical protein B6V74_09590 [Thioclava sp. F42-5]
MRMFEKTLNTQEVAVAAIGAARDLADAMKMAPFEKLSRHELIPTFEAGEILLEPNSGELDALAELVLEMLEELAPGYREIALAYDTDGYQFSDGLAEATRRVWARLDAFRALRQRLLDYMDAERLLFRLNLMAIERQRL